MNQYLYRIQPARPTMLSEGTTPEEDAIVSEHFSYLQTLNQQGIVLLAGRTLNTDSTSFGIIIFEAENDDSAHSLMENDPAVKKGVMKAELFPYRVALMAK
ncbi:MAG: YciI family protein [Anaerolineae bacterium]|nr:YciI family protein [Anaerolineae bacterium]